MKGLLAFARNRTLDNVLGLEIFSSLEVSCKRHRFVVVYMHGVAVLHVPSGLLTVWQCHTDLSAGCTGGAGLVVVECRHDELGSGVYEVESLDVMLVKAE
jgi:hypothetical protein